MKRVMQVMAVAVLAFQALVIGQGDEAQRVLGEMRAALGGRKLEAVKTFTATGRASRSIGQFQMAGEFEVLCELPDKYLRVDRMTLGPASIDSTLGFNGPDLIQEASSPQMPGLGGAFVMRMGAAGAMPGGMQLTPEQQEAARAGALAAAKTDFARLALVLFGNSFAGFPLEFTHAGQAEAADGKADVIDATGEGGFTLRLFVDTETRLPLMLSWQGMAPQIVTRGGGPGAAAGAGQGGHQGAQPAFEMPPARQVEHRIYVGEYREVDGVKLPHRIVRAIDGQTSEETTFERFRLNNKIDAKKFQVRK